MVFEPENHVIVVRRISGRHFPTALKNFVTSSSVSVLAWTRTSRTSASSASSAVSLLSAFAVWRRLWRRVYHQESSSSTRRNPSNKFLQSAKRATESKKSSANSSILPKIHRNKSPRRTEIHPRTFSTRFFFFLSSPVHFAFTTSDVMWGILVVCHFQCLLSAWRRTLWSFLPSGTSFEFRRIIGKFGGDRLFIRVSYGFRQKISMTKS